MLPKNLALTCEKPGKVETQERVRPIEIHDTNIRESRSRMFIAGRSILAGTCVTINNALLLRLAADQSSRNVAQSPSDIASWDQQHCQAYTIYVIQFSYSIQPLS